VEHIWRFWRSDWGATAPYYTLLENTQLYSPSKAATIKKTNKTKKKKRNKTLQHKARYTLAIQADAGDMYPSTCRL